MRSPEPALVIDLTEAEEPGKNQDDTARASVLRHKAMVIPQGTIIPAVLETPIDSTAPGPVRAITSKATFGFDGSRDLVPKGSRLYGEYQSSAQVGQARVVVNWTRLTRPDGISIRLASPASDSRGEPGVPGHVNNHTLARLTGAVLQTSLAIGTELAARPGTQSVVVGTPAQSLAPILPVPPNPTITVPQGADISVFVARDLDFAGSLPRQ